MSALQLSPDAIVHACSCPTALHLGSGKNFREGMLNIDADPIWRPDIVADLNQVFPAESGTYQTDRFGRITLAPGSFDEIVANDLLEHLRELPTLMESCLNLLRVGGVFHISVPYELSLGAWSDPTHVRAFNERSWEYFTNWGWYFGWVEHSFVMRKLEFVASDYGRKLEAEGKSLEELLPMPRTIDSMRVELEKIELNDETRSRFRQLYERRRV